MKAHFYLIVLAVLAFSCRKEQPVPAAGPEVPENTGPVVFTVNVDGLQLREAPGPQGKVLQGLKLGEALTDLGEVSDFTTAVRLRGVAFDEPWIKVRTESGKEGWVYGGGLSFESIQEGKRTALLLEKRLQTFFGAELAKRIEDYREKSSAAGTAAELADVFLRSQKLRDQLNTRLEKGIQITDTGELPDLFWLNASIPGYVPQLVAEGTMYTLFADYGAWARRAASTRGQEDDDFFALCLQFFPEDSIEYFFPSYFIQTWDYGGHSLLGRGTHKQLLSGLDRLYRAKSPFMPALLELKAGIVDDITLAEQSFWEKQDAAVRELEAILSADYALLDKTDKAGLQVRLEQLRDPDRNKIQMNQQSGQ